LHDGSVPSRSLFGSQLDFQRAGAGNPAETWW
jgi:hypothetical protein